MNETQTHFITSCPYCSTQLRIRRGFAGQHVQCKHCNETFVAKEADGPATAASGEVDPVRPLPPVSQEERVIVNCPSCQASLSIRRVYIGRQVRCKQCDEIFLASDSAAAIDLSPESRRDRDGIDTERAALQAEVDRLSSENQRLRDEHHSLRADRERTSTESERLKAELDRQKLEANRLRGALDRATTDLEGIRAHLGEISPAAVRPLFEERASLIAELDRLRDEIQVFRDEQSARDRTAGEREEELIAGRAELDRLTGLLAERGAELEEARSEPDRLNADRQRALDEADQLRIERDRLRSEAENIRRSLDDLEQDHREELSRRDEQLREAAHARNSILGEGDQLRNEIDGLRRALEDVEQGRRDEIGRLDAELAGVAEQRQQLQGRIEAAELSCKELRARNQELQADLDRSRPALDSGDELQAARDEIETLKRSLDVSDQLQREMAGILAGMGIRIRQV
jgi:predicted Zn finger-like uncharacterized protein